MHRGWILVFTVLFCTGVFAQADPQRLFDTEKAFDRAVAEQGQKAAFLEYLADDSVIFHPNAVNGREFWRTSDDPATLTLVRKTTYADIASNGLMGYTTGNWRLYPKGKSESAAKFGQYVTIWERKPDGKFRASLDIGITHDKLTFTETDRVLSLDKRGDPNKRGWSPADASMNFLRASMTQGGLSGAYATFAALDVRLLVEQEPPILGKKRVVSLMRRYTSIDFPRKVAMYQAADMAYVWNPCSYANSNEGTEKGNCLHIWKLRNKKWWIVLGVFERVEDPTQPELKVRQKNKASQ